MSSNRDEAKAGRKALQAPVLLIPPGCNGHGRRPPRKICCDAKTLDGLYAWDSDAFLESGLRLHHRPLPFLSLLGSTRPIEVEEEVAAAKDVSRGGEYQCDDWTFHVPLLNRYAEVKENERGVLNVDVNGDAKKAEDVVEEGKFDTFAKIVSKPAYVNVSLTQTKKTAVAHSSLVRSATTGCLGVTPGAAETAAGACVDGLGAISSNALDNSISSLTPGQHERYLALRDMYLSGTLLGAGPLAGASGVGVEDLVGMSLERRDRQQKKRWLDEFRTLRECVRNERRSYADALVRFREANAERFLLGFKVKGLVSKFVDATAKGVQRWQRRWKQGNMDFHYGKYSQSISFPHIDGISIVASACDVVVPEDSRKALAEANDRGGFDIDAFRSTIVGTRCFSCSREDSGRGPPRTSLRRIADARDIPLTDYNPHHYNIAMKNGRSEPLLCEDEMAKSLALRHGATVVLTEEAFAVLLRHPRDKLTRWKIPVRKVVIGGDEGRRQTRRNKEMMKTLVFVEDPVPQATTPRECLSQAVEGPLFASLLDPVQAKAEITETVGGGRRENLQYVYTSLQLPTPAPSGGRCKVLVRTANDLLLGEEINDNDDNNSPLPAPGPVRRYVQLEYFLERGRERCTPNDRALWLMEKLLQPTATVLVGRVEVGTAMLLGWEEKSAAFALASDDDGLDLKGGLGMSSRFETAGSVLRAVDKLLKPGRYLLCLPATCGKTLASSSWSPSQSPIKSVSVSVHEAVDAKEGTPFVDLEKELSKAESVFTHRDALLSCYRMWEWKKSQEEGGRSITEDGTARKQQKRVPYTFDLPGDNIPCVPAKKKIRQ